MEIVFDREAFASKFSLAASIAPPRSPKEILRNVKVTASDGSVSLSATDMEVGVRTDVDGIVAIKSEGSALLPVQRMGAILRESSAETLSLKATDNGLVVKSNRSTFRLPHANPDEFPPVAAFDGERYHRVSGRMFRSMIRQTAFAAAEVSSRMALGGVAFEMLGDEVVTVGTDGKRLGSCVGKGVANGEHCVSCSVVPVYSCQPISRVIQDSDEYVDVAFDHSSFKMRTESTTMHARLVEGRYPDWRQVIPSNSRYAVDMCVGTFMGAVREAAIVTDRESRAIGLNFANGVLRFSASTADVGQSAVEIPVAFDGDELSVSVDHQYLLDFCKAVDKSETFTLSMSDGTTPLKLTTAGGYTYVIMPLAKN